MLVKGDTRIHNSVGISHDIDTVTVAYDIETTTALMMAPFLVRNHQVPVFFFTKGQ